MAEGKSSSESLEQALAESRQREKALARRVFEVEGRRWWLKLAIRPVIVCVVVVVILASIGAAQRLGLLSGSTTANSKSSEGHAKRYICPMMCTPPQSAPGRCPVCAMELVPATTGEGGPSSEITVSTASRRIARIETAAVRVAKSTRVVKAIGELMYDEGSLKTIAAYVDGRIEKLYADYTGVSVSKHDQLALLYSPKLYSGQVELLLARHALAEASNQGRGRVNDTRVRLYEGAKRRLIEFGVTDRQLRQLEKENVANSRLELCSPISGTVIEKLAMEGQYVKEGQAIYRLADLSQVWLMLQLFPEDAASIRYGQRVEAVVRSMPGKTFVGRVVFINPKVDAETRTVGVRVVIPNPSGKLRVGDYASATLHATGNVSDNEALVYDEELSNKWISPRHPYVIETQPGKCRVCGIPLVPSLQFGYAPEQSAGSNVLVIPSGAVLSAAGKHVVYVETVPGKFELKKVVIGDHQDGNVAILDGLKEGDQVAVRGNFLIDSQMQLAGNPSLIDPEKYVAPTVDAPSAKVLEALAKLSEQDRAIAEKQRICPVANSLLGAMGPPIKVEVSGTSVFICCEGCRESLTNNPQKYLAILEEGAKGDGLDVNVGELPPMGTMDLMPPADSSQQQPNRPTGEEKPHANDDGDVANRQLSARDYQLAQLQQTCPVAGTRLGAMGTPVKVEINGRVVFVCCGSCRAPLLSNPALYLAKLPKGSVQR